MRAYKFLAMAAVMSAVLFVLPGISSAQTVTDTQLQSQINALLAEVAQLQTLLTQQSGGTGFCYTFTTNLSVGMSGAGVTALQTALQKDGESVTVNGTFDDQTASAVTGFQEKYASQILTPSGLQYGTGYVGAATRAKLNSLYGCGTSTTITTTPAPSGYPSGCTSSSGYSSTTGQPCSSTSVTPSASLTLTATADTYPNFHAGDNFVLQVASNQPSTLFSLCSNFTPGAGSTGTTHVNQCTTSSMAANYVILPLGTDASGNHSWNGSWDSSAIGTWTEWVQFGSYTSPAITFTVNVPAASTAPISTGCTSSSGYSSTTGQPCSSGTTVPLTASLNLLLTGGNYQAGSNFTLQMTSNEPSAPFYLCSNFMAGTGSTGTSHTNQCVSSPLIANSGGDYTWNGNWDSSAVGVWTEWVQFGSYTSPAITFTITAPTSVSSPLFSVSLDPSTPIAGSAIMGSVNVPAMTFDVSTPTRGEAVKLQSVTVAYSTNASSPQFSNLTLWNGNTQVANATSFVGNVSPYTATFYVNMAAPLVVPSGGTLALTVNGNVTVYQTMPSAVGTTGTFTIPSGGVTGIGNTSGIAAIGSGSASGNPMTITALVSQQTPSASLALTATGDTYPNFHTGDNFTLQLTSNQPSQLFSLCSNFTPGVGSTGTGHTNQCISSPLTANSAGDYTWNGSWDSSAIGTWTEWVQIGSYVSPTISFTVTAPGATVAAYNASYDYNNDGVIDQNDLGILEFVANNLEPCPAGKICDVNGDGVVNILDITKFKSMFNLN